MKLLYIVIDGMGDLPIEKLNNQTPLEAAKTPNMDKLAKDGKTGLMYTVKQGIAPESDVAVISLLGYDPFKYSTGRGIIEAVGADIKLKDGELAVRCNFATAGEGKTLIDRRVGRNLTTEEATELCIAARQQVTLTSHPATFEFKNTLGHRSVLVIRHKEKKLSGKISNSDPAYDIIDGLGVAVKNVEMVVKTVKPLDDSQEAKISADLVNEFIEKTRNIWENHPVNLKRVSEGNLKANVLLTRDARSKLPAFFDINRCYDVSFYALADMITERGIAKLAGMDAELLPPPSGDLKKDCELRAKRLLEVLPNYDCFYIHLKGPDEPGHDGDCERKTEIIAAIDQHFFGNLLPQIKLDQTIICITADHSTPCNLKIHSDTPVPLLISGGKIVNDATTCFSEKECSKGNLGTLNYGHDFMPKLMQLLKA
ncbi:MAG: 2,3-bisphosphoglycerate-independent phosphoglycerate mutase [Crenarchaeota archaeon]|nr:2,3-bisphosphoglycerate-independent phosphoglycerate mutase [Thermoproteota archaeon]